VDSTLLEVAGSSPTGGFMKDKGNPMWIGMGLVLGIAIGAAYGNIGFGTTFGIIIGAVIFSTVKISSGKEDSDADSSQKDSQE
jgi:hypothetical protein